MVDFVLLREEKGGSVCRGRVKKLVVEIFRKLILGL